LRSSVDECWTSACDQSSVEAVHADPRVKTIIIFDWDDTLLCSTAINQSTAPLEERKRLEVAAMSALNAAMAIGETVIVTNGNATWVKDSCTKFLPGLLPTIAKVQVVSARAIFESRYPGDPFMWKRAAFKHLLAKERQFAANECLNLVALGDQMPEIEAAHAVTMVMGAPSRAKTVKLREQPSIGEIIGQLRKVEEELPRLAAEDFSGEFAMVARSPWKAGAPPTAAAGWSLTRTNSNLTACGQSLSLRDVLPIFG